jgi:hypothetical protein
MQNKKLMFGLMILSLLLCTSFASAYISYNNYNPIRVGGFFGQNSNYIINLRPGTYYQNCYQGVPSMLYQPCSNTRIGGWFGYAPYNSNYYYGLRTGMPVYGTNYYGQYSNINYLYNGIL